jgi:hypothetical protein
MMMIGEGAAKRRGGGKEHAHPRPLGKRHRAAASLSL